MSDDLRLRVRAEPLSIVRLDAGGPLPDWALSGPGIAAVVRRADELTIVRESSGIPGGLRTEAGWCALEVAGPLDFSLTGVLRAIADPLADAGVSIFALSTYDTDLVLVRTAAVPDAVRALRAAGHTVDVSRVS